MTNGTNFDRTSEYVRAVEAWRSFLKRLTIGQPMASWNPILEVIVDSNVLHSVKLRLAWTNPDSRPPHKMGTLAMTEMVHVSASHSEAHMRATVEDMLRRWVMHELDESVRLDGVLLHDPHAGDITPTGPTR